LGAIGPGQSLACWTEPAWRRYCDDRRPIVLKPNLVKAAPPPITTPVALVAALVDYLQQARPGAKIVVAEGCGAKDYDTDHCFAALGYARMAMERGVELVDLNQAPLTRLSRPQYGRWPEMHLPSLLLDAFLISVPVLKAHTLAKVTLTMKNMMGAAPPARYQQGGTGKKPPFTRVFRRRWRTLTAIAAPTSPCLTPLLA